MHASPDLLDRMENLGVRQEELHESFSRSGGPGGQHVNKVSSAATIRHLPSGLVVTASDSRSQAANRRLALSRLLDLLAKAKRDDLRARRAAAAKVRRQRARRSRATKLKLVEHKRRRGETKKLRRKMPGALPDTLGPQDGPIWLRGHPSRSDLGRGRIPF